jgi:transcriptional regulator with XRE-family HTH domain
MRYDLSIMSDLKNPRPRLVGSYIRQRREVLGLSQRALGLLFTPAVTTQFISNVERGVTPLPPAHVPTLSKALQVSEADIMSLLEREYSAKLTERLGKADDGGVHLPAGSAPVIPGLTVQPSDIDFMKSLYLAYQQADSKTRQTFATVCESILNLSKTG